MHLQIKKKQTAKLKSEHVRTQNGTLLQVKNATRKQTNFATPTNKNM